jgi:acyl-CoA thioester hydrolase
MRSMPEPTLSVDDYRFRHQVRVRFSETDAMGIVHHSRYLPYLEEARVAYLRHIGHSYAASRVDGVDYAVLEAHVAYRQPLRFDELVTVHLRLSSVSRASFSMAYLLTVDDDIRATARTMHGCVNAEGRPVRLPAWLPALADS